MCLRQCLTSLELSRKALLCHLVSSRVSCLHPPRTSIISVYYDTWLLCWLWARTQVFRLPALIASTVLIKSSPSRLATIFASQTELNRTRGKFTRLLVSQVRCCENRPAARPCFLRLTILTRKTELNPGVNSLKGTSTEFEHLTRGANIVHDTHPWESRILALRAATDRTAPSTTAEVQSHVPGSNPTTASIQ